ncbi:MAG TPA: hypothetical protein DCM87_00850 [Planctomycetes bacterium]|nr:hypothetical protein [Planctomycetota bacterium]
MKRKILVGVVVCLSLGLNVALLLPHVGQEAALAGPPSGNGDVNGSGGIDIADAVYILSYLFAQGPAPEAIEIVACDSCCPPPSGGAVPATGQTACYGYVAEQGWVEVPCDSAEYPGQDGYYQSGCPTAGRFTDNGDGTVTDNCTGLVWQKDTADVNGDGTIVWEQDTLTWQNALKYCESLEFAGHDDWRLPNVRELQSIVDYGRRDPSIDPVFGAKSERYWSSSTHVSLPGYAWLVYFYDGYVFDVVGKGRLSFVRAVRG